MDVDLDGLFRHNGSYDYDQDYEYQDEVESRDGKTVLIPVLYSLELVVGLLGNGLLLAALAQKRQSWRISDTFILHLCVADVLLLMTLPFWAAQATQQCGWCFDGFLCKTSGAIFNINFYCGMFLLVCICLDRYLSTVHDTQLFLRRPRIAHMSCLLVWLCSLILTIPDWLFVVARKHSAQDKASYVHTYCQWKGPLVSRLLHHTLGFLLPAAALVLCCSHILLQLQRSSRGLQKQRSVVVLLPLVGVFLLFWMPYNITLIVDTVRSSAKKPNGAPPGNPGGSLKAALMATSVLGCLHACLRPLLYLGLCANFRNRTLATLRRAAVTSEGSLWELGVGEEARPDQSHERGELEQMTTVDQQVKSTQC